MNQKIGELLIKENIRYYEDVGIYQFSRDEIEKFVSLNINECDNYVADCYDECEPWMQPAI